MKKYNFRFENYIITEDSLDEFKSNFEGSSLTPEDFEYTGVILDTDLENFFTSILKDQEVSGNVIDQYGNEVYFEECTTMVNENEDTENLVLIKFVKCENDLFRVSIQIKQIKNEMDESLFQHELSYILTDKELLALSNKSVDITTEIGGDFYNGNNYGLVISTSKNGYYAR